MAVSPILFGEKWKIATFAAQIVWWNLRGERIYKMSVGLFLGFFFGSEIGLEEIE